ncbi:capsid protein [Capybara virus 33_cap3_6684]|uniref:Capsid protein n=1 Tax=Capybara virus 33_cap3_6684 TaxID=2585062 RepID=A0A514TS31_9VIRU|nr:capsid protein [Capybara virus 33_cap3_6684]
MPAVVKRKAGASPGSWRKRARKVGYDILAAGGNYLARNAKKHLTSYFKKWRSRQKGGPIQRRSARKSSYQANAIQSASQHNDLSSERHTIMLGAPKKLYKALGKWDYRWSVRGSTQGVQAEGVQYACDAVAYVTQNYLTAVASTSRSNPYGISDNIYNLNPYQATTGSSVFTAQATPISDYVHIHDIESDYLITNFSQVACWMEVIWFTPRTQTNVSPTEAWGQAEANKRLGQTGEGAAASTATATATAGYPTYNGVSLTLGGSAASMHYGMSPFADKQFNYTYKKLCSTKFSLQGGDTRKISVKTMVNKTFSKGFANQQQNFQYIKGRTVFATIIVRPSIAIIQDAGGAIEPTTANCHIAWVINNKMNLSSLGAQRLEYNRGFTSTIVAGGAPAHATLNEIIVNDVDAQVTNTRPV